MTVKQFRKKADIALKCGEAALDDGCVLYYHGPQYGWSLHDKDGQTVTTAYSPEQFEFLFE